MNWNWQVIIDSLPQLLKASLLTIELVGFSAVLGLALGVVVALLRLHKSWWVKGVPFAFIFFFRGTPLLVQIFLIYYGLSQFDFIKDSFLWEPVFKQPFWCAIIAFTLNTGAYIAEIIRGAIESIPKGELEAADAIGMSPVQKLTRITLPRAFGIMIPAYSNEVIFMLKGSALASAITFPELMYMSGKLISKTYASLELFFITGVIYLLLSWVLMFTFRLLEKHFNRHNSYVPPEAMAGTIGQI